MNQLQLSFEKHEIIKELIVDSVIDTSKCFQYLDQKKYYHLRNSAKNAIASLEIIVNHIDSLQ